MEKRIKILHGCPFEGWPNRAWPFHSFWQKGLGWPCPVRSALKNTHMQGFNYFSIMFNIHNTYQKIRDLFCLVHIYGLLHSVKRRQFNFFLFSLAPAFCTFNQSQSSAVKLWIVIKAGGKYVICEKTTC